MAVWGLTPAAPSSRQQQDGAGAFSASSGGGESEANPTGLRQQRGERSMLEKLNDGEDDDVSDSTQSSGEDNDLEITCKRGRGALRRPPTSIHGGNIQNMKNVLRCGLYSLSVYSYAGCSNALLGCFYSGWSRCKSWERVTASFVQVDDMVHSPTEELCTLFLHAVIGPHDDPSLRYTE